MNFTYRIGTIEDKEALRQLALISYGQFKADLTERNWNELHAILNDERSYTDILSIAKCFVCELNNELIGVAYIVPSGNPTDIFQSDWSYIRMVGVHPTSRGHRIGEKLTTMCIDYARQHNEKTIALHTSEFMDAARHIYEGIGFKQIKELDNLFGKRYWLYRLEI